MIQQGAFETVVLFSRPKRLFHLEWRGRNDFISLKLALHLNQAGKYKGEIYGESISGPKGSDELKKSIIIDIIFVEEVYKTSNMNVEKKLVSQI